MDKPMPRLFNPPPPAADPTRQALDDVVAESLAIILPALLLCIWAWAAYTVLFHAALTSTAYAVLLTASLSALAAYQLAPHRWRAAVAVYLGGLFVAVTLLVAAVPAATALYVPFIVVAATLAGIPATVLLALACAALATLGGLQAGQTLELALLPSLLIGLTALTALVSSRRLYTALAWALNMTEQARRSAEAAQNHRAELRRVLQTLDIAYDRLERTNRALIFAQESAEQAYRFKSEFVANVSHELRTPLNLIVGFSEMMATAPESYGGVPLPPAYRGDMLATWRNACHLLELINDVLDLSQLEAGQLPLTRQQSDLREIVRDAAGMVQGLADASGLDLQISLPSDPLSLRLDRTRIRQVLLNLLTNAMRYTERGYVRVTVTVSAAAGAAQDAAGEVTVSVADSGRGIDPANLQRAFEAFSRLDETQLRDGSGLGLAISKKFIELHDGRIWIASELGKGTTVTFTLPLPDPRSLPRAAAGLSSRLDQTQLPRVLVLHEDARTLSILRRHVAECEFHLVTDAAAARTSLQELPDAVLQDAAWAAAAGAEPLALPPHLPRITCPLPALRHLGLLLGADDYLPKPVTREDLAAALARLPQPPKTALLVDDDPHVVRLISRMLRTLDQEIHCYEAYNGQEALQIARSRRPDVILLDLNMPQMGGRSVIDALRAERDAAPAGGPEGGRIPIIVVSVRSVEEERTPLGGELRIDRPDGFTLSELLQLLNAVLPTLTRPDAVSPASAAARLSRLPG
jgi:signal transduction histidine kinase/DNA-binding response OmpR family regulator